MTDKVIDSKDDKALCEAKRKAIAARRARELRNIREAEETEEAIEQWRSRKYND